MSIVSSPHLEQSASRSSGCASRASKSVIVSPRFLDWNSDAPLPCIGDVSRSTLETAHHAAGGPARRITGGLRRALVHRCGHGVRRRQGRDRRSDVLDRSGGRGQGRKIHRCRHERRHPRVRRTPHACRRSQGPHGDSGPDGQPHPHDRGRQSRDDRPGDPRKDRCRNSGDHFGVHQGEERVRRASGWRPAAGIRLRSCASSAT